jgi:hypothetical protein
MIKQGSTGLIVNKYDKRASIMPVPMLVFMPLINGGS